MVEEDKSSISGKAETKHPGHVTSSTAQKAERKQSPKAKKSKKGSKKKDDGSKKSPGSEQKDSDKISNTTQSTEPDSEKPLAGRGTKKASAAPYDRVTGEGAGVTLIWKEITVRVPVISGGGFKMPRIPLLGTDNCDTRVVLDKVSGIAKPGELLAIMGGSGAGKTTLLNVLTNIDQKDLKKSGTVTINGEPLKADILKRVSAYVQQYDIFIGTLTVREQITFSAKLRMGRRATEEEKKKRIEEVIRDFNLTNAQNTMIGVPNRQKGISIGEKKRLAFASEILTDPYLFFCDEPTSGLDSFMAKQVAIMMRRMAHNGKTVITTIHQPSSEVFNMFDKVCFMAHGRIVYLGPTSEVCNFWESVGPSFACPKTFNPADHVIRTLSATSKDDKKNQLRVERIRRCFEKSDFAKKLRSEIENYNVTPERAEVLKGRPNYAANWITQLWALLMRSFRTTLRDPLLLKVRLIQVVVTSVIIGIVNLNIRSDPVIGTTITNMEGVLYNCARDMNFMFLFPSVNVITGELPIFLREHRSGIYSVDTYYFSKSLAELPQYTILPIIYSIFVYWMTGLQRTIGSFIIFAAFNMMQTYVAISMAYAGACTFAEESLALTYMPVIVLPMLVFGGFYISFHSIPTYFKWVSYLSWYRYGFEGLMANQWNDDLPIGGCSPNNGTLFHNVSLVEQASSYCPATTSSELMVRRGMEGAEWWFDLLVLFVMFVVLRFAGLLALTLRVSDFKLMK
ncbi:hypothetical protein QR680_004759 [Steinernema hermaphroditum]|uniref:ABC transporter domain-containing protein n=1 Tax=Steinernema hermaphroditum TaxID=289476 RepID=A0AA39LUH9_9BILA|nr:hypothetical protein QR680_004759 [Steinernema hermaphroditum]